MKITDIVLAEVSDDKFYAQFTYDGHVLRTRHLLRTIEKLELKTELRNTVSEWIAKRADDNFAVLKDFFEGKEISVDD